MCFIKNVFHDFTVSNMSGRSPEGRARQPTPVFLPGESQGQRSLARYSPWGCKESDTTEVPSHTHTHNMYTDGHLREKSTQMVQKILVPQHRGKQRFLIDSFRGLFEDIKYS